jgi:cytochrome c peroxidase
MSHRSKGPLLGLVFTFIFALYACDAADSISQVSVDAPAYAKGGNKGGNPPPGGESLVALGARLFADESLSLNGNQSCQTCHEASEGFAAPLVGVTTLGSVVQGSVAGQFGDRKPPSAAFATMSPIFVAGGNNATGGNFWDGRATGEILGNPAMDQALGPFLNPREQAMPDEACVIWRLAQDGGYVSSFASLWDVDLSTIDFPGDVASVCGTFTEEPGPLVSLSAADRETVHAQYQNVARAIAAFEDSFNTFDSSFDLGQLTATEAAGEKLFGSKGKCQQCHDNKGATPLYTDFRFHNLGVPLNPANPVHNRTSGTFDPGLGGVTEDPAHLGKFKTPTARNVALGENRTYMHNGALVSLRHVVQFYNTRDILPVCTDEAVLNDPEQWGPDGAGCWPPPEYPENLDTRNMGNLGLTSAEVDAIVAFMEALTGSGGTP